MKHTWKVNWTGAIRNFPGLESLIPDFPNLEDAIKEHVSKIEASVLAYFHQHTNDNGALAIEASVDPQGEHSANITIAAIPTSVHLPPQPALSSEDAVAEADASQEVDPNADKFVVQAVGNGVSLVFGEAKGVPFASRAAAEAHKANVSDERLGTSPTLNVVEVTAEQVEALTIEGPAE